MPANRPLPEGAALIAKADSLLSTILPATEDQFELVKILDLMRSMAFVAQKRDEVSMEELRQVMAQRAENSTNLIKILLKTSDGRELIPTTFSIHDLCSTPQEGGAN